MQYADLSGADLHAANLNHVNLSEVNLSESDLREISLDQINLAGAYLDRTDLRSIPWGIIKELTLQPGVLCEKIRYDLLAEETRQEEEGSTPSEPL